MTYLEYEAYEPLALRAFERIAQEIHAPGGRHTLALHHRTGRLEIGEASIVIVAASPHRAEAFAACRYAIERVKQIAPIWKHEHFDGGESGSRARRPIPDDESARAEALSARMRVTVRLFARLRDIAGAGELERDVAGAGDDLGGLGRARQPIPGAGAVRADRSRRRVNLDYARMDTAVRDGDEVAFLPPVSGGSRGAAASSRRIRTTSRMFDKLTSVEARYDELTACSADPAVQADPAEYRKHARRSPRSSRSVERFREYKRRRRNCSRRQELAARGDPDMRALARRS